MGRPGIRIGNRNRVEMPVHGDRRAIIGRTEGKNHIGSFRIERTDILLKTIFRRPFADELHDGEFLATWTGNGDELTGECDDIVAVDLIDKCLVAQNPCPFVQKQAFSPNQRVRKQHKARVNGQKTTLG